MTAPLFSVIIPCWNAEKTIAATLRSVLDQTLADWEVIVIDDGSTDGSAEILAEFAARDRRITYRTVENGGPSRARNLGAIELAKGRYIAFLDADDLWAADKLEIMAARFAEDIAVQALYADVAFFTNVPEDAQSRTNVRRDQLFLRDVLAENPFCTTSNLVVERKAFAATGGFDETIVYGEDLEWLVRFVAMSGVIEGVDQTLVYYRNTPGSLSSNIEAMATAWQSRLATLRKMQIGLAEKDLRAAEAQHLRYLARRALRSEGSRFTPMRFALRGVWTSPVSFFNNPRRGLLTLAAACALPFFPQSAGRPACFQ
ncbi:glycosyltransferase family 2 protein [Afifella aestuarii]|uniref:glycosyltransferase family 2 protein n=1 Tax=Afifella aestuarii TaxID=1909496 RepID=UPI000FE43E7A|nr:glycosyltransferase [Afifella aestuarii]